MMHCSDCEHFIQGPDGKVGFRCDPLRNIKEPECLVKWQIIRLAEVSAKLDRMVSAYEGMAEMNKRLAPLQEKMFRHMEREIEAAEEGDAWKTSADWDDSDDEEEDDDRVR